MGVTTIKRLAGPLALTGTKTTNVYNPASGYYAIIRQIHFANNDSSNHNFDLFLSTTGDNTAGKEQFKGKVVAANDTYDWYCFLRMDNADFLVGGADTTTKIAMTIMGELYST